MRRRPLLLSFALTGSLLVAGVSCCHRPATARPGVVETPAAVPVMLDAAALATLKMDNVRQLSPKMISGSQPETDEDFKALAKLGVRTIVSVDGSMPHVEDAEKYGMRYIHIPYGYDGVPREAQVKLASVYAETPTLMYVHCHHGKHRGPAGAVSMLICNGEMTPDEGVAMLKELGTAASYSGLYRDVQNAKPVDASEHVALNTLPSRAKVEGLVDTMVAIDVRSDNLKRVAGNAWKVLPDHPDIDPAHEALMLKELLHEIARENAPETQVDGFGPELAFAERAATELESGIREGLAPDILDARRNALEQSCNSCHKTFRN